MTSPRSPRVSTSFKRIAWAIWSRRLPVRDVRQEAQLARPLDRDGELRLVTAAGAGNTRRADLALVADRAPQRREVLVIDDVDLLPAERAWLEAPARGALAAGAALAVPRLCSTTLLRHLYSCVLATPGSERNVVVRRPPGGYRRLREVGGVRRNVALRRETAAVLAALAGAEELNGVGNDIDRLPLVAALVLPLAPLEPPVDRDRPPLGEVLRAVLALGAPYGDVEVVRLVDPLAGRLVLAARVHGHAQAADRGAAVRVPQLK